MTQILLPVADTSTLDDTVDAAIERGLSTKGETVIRVVYLPVSSPGRSRIDVDPASVESLVDMVRNRIEAAASERPGEIVVETEVLTDETLERADDISEIITAAIREGDFEVVLLDPAYEANTRRSLFGSLTRALEESGTSVELALSHEGASDLRMPHRGDFKRSIFIFGLTVGFYLLLAGKLTPFELISGLITATIVTVTLGGLALWHPPGIRYTPARLARVGLYIPYLLVMIIRSNITVALVILNPKLPIEPRVVRYRPALYGPLPMTTMANSITLTPGTLSMRIQDGDLLVHTLTRSAREDLLGGRLERAVRFLFYGRSGMRVPSPVERGDTTVNEPRE